MRPAKGRLTSSDISPDNANMDDFDLALERLRTDERSLQSLSRESGIAMETLRDIKSGHVKSPRLDTLRKLVALYAVEVRAA